MKVSLNWLKQFVDVQADARELKTALTSVGLGVESFVPVGDDVVFEVEVTTNRPDCLNHYGVAREVAAIYRLPLKPTHVDVKEAGAPASSEIAIEIAARDLCARYCGRVIQNVQVKASPAWLTRRLESVGMRSINNVADVTNYVLMELGHPLHAFDLARLRQKKIIVRRARPGEHLRTLDGVDHVLKPEQLVIADAERAVALAGVMGGQESEISLATRCVLLESAWFDPLSIRRTAKAHGLHTEASHRFERGADVAMAPVAIDRAAALIQELAGGEVLAGIVDVYPEPKPRASITLRQSEIRRILGATAEIAREEVERILRALDFVVERRGDAEWQVIPPTFRLDVTREVDLIEEIARLYGYDRLPARVRPAPPRVERDTRREKELAVYAALVGLGYREIITSSMVDPEENARFTHRPPVPLVNPLSQEASVLRSSTIPSMIAALRWNLDRGQNEVRLFELGKTYTLPPGGSPEERRVLTLGLSGPRRAASVHDAAKPLDFFDLKGDLESLLDEFGVHGLEFKSDGCGAYEPGLGARYTDSSDTLAVFGKLAEDVARDYKLRQDVWLAEVDLKRLLAYPLRMRRFRPYTKFPTVERDFSLVLPDTLHYAEVEGAVRRALAGGIQSVWPVDLFRGGSIPAGHYSLLLRVTFFSLERTLTSEEVEELSRRLLDALKPLGVRLRGQTAGS
ncbi:MAG TPA: phenylalanine--tRNA ligase subunit beta [Terriglobia bacterium]|nr:phenylalanine--tRNA ligase subunit beta [Terriglobia bacterium]